MSPSSKIIIKGDARGVVLVLLLLVLPLIIGILALAIDLFALSASSLSQSNSAEYAAIAALRSFLKTTGNYSERKDSAYQNAKNVLSNSSSNATDRSVISAFNSSAEIEALDVGLWADGLFQPRQSSLQVNAVKIKLALPANSLNSFAGKLLSPVLYSLHTESLVTCRDIFNSDILGTTPLTIGDSLSEGTSYFCASFPWRVE